MSTPNNRRRDPGGIGAEAILLWVGILAVVGFGDEIGGIKVFYGNIANINLPGYDECY